MKTCCNCDAKLGIYEHNLIDEKLHCDKCFANNSSNKPVEKAIGTPPEEFIEVASYIEEFNALQAESYLQSADIPVQLRDQNTSAVDTMGMRYAIGGTKIWVPKSKYSDALEILNALEKEVSTDDKNYTFLVAVNRVPMSLLSLSLPLLITLFILVPAESVPFRTFSLIIIAIIPGLIIGKKASTYECTEFNCSAPNKEHATHCASCKREIKAVLKHIDDKMRKEEELGLE